MVGRLARYLRFVGHDTGYVRGLSDAEVARRATEEQRTLITRDRELARRVPGALLLDSVELSAQLRRVRAAAPTASFEVAFHRCTLCNGTLETWSPPPPGEWPAGVPRDRIAAGLPVFRCASCAHLYWDGSHTAEVRERLRAWLG